VLLPVVVFLFGRGRRVQRLVPVGASRFPERLVAAGVSGAAVCGINRKRALVQSPSRAKEEKCDILFHARSKSSLNSTPYATMRQWPMSDDSGENDLI